MLLVLYVCRTRHSGADWHNHYDDVVVSSENNRSNTVAADNRNDGSIGDYAYRCSRKPDNGSDRPDAAAYSGLASDHGNMAMPTDYSADDRTHPITADAG